MRTLLKVTLNVQAGNKAIVENKLGSMMGKLAETLQPEAAYFLTEGGQRTAIYVFDLKDTSDIPKIAEPLFTQLDAQVQFSPVMNKDELQKGLEAWSKSQ